MSVRSGFLPIAASGIATILFLIGGPHGARAQGAAGVRVTVDRERGQTVDELVALALRQAPDALSTRARADAARGDLDQAGRRPNPSLSVEQREEAGGMDAQTAVGFTWPLDLFRREGRLAVARSGLDAAEASSAERDRQIATATRLLAARLLAALRVLQVREDVAASNRTTVDLIAARVESGSAPAVERDAAVVEAARAEVDARRQRADVEMLAARLRTAVGLVPEAPLVLKESLEEVVAHSDVAMRDWLSQRRPEEAIAERPDVRVADAEVARALAREDLARREGRMDVSLFASYMRMTAGFPQLGLSASGQPEPIEGRFHNLAAGVMVMLPWRNRNQGAAAAAAAEGTAARFEREGRRIAALNEVEGLRRQEAAVREAAALFDDGVRDLARKTVEVMRESYQLGRATLVDVLAETRRFLDLELAYATTQLELVEARVALVAALGGGR